MRGFQSVRLGVPIAAVLVAMCLGVGIAQAAQPLGALTQLPGVAGCFTHNGTSEDGAGTCSVARGMARGESTAVSPDGANVYVGSYANPSPSLLASIDVFSRDPATGALTQLAGTAGCLTTDGSSSAGPGTCTKARGLVTAVGDGHDIAFSSDGRWVYVTAQNQDPTGVGSIMIFQRNPATGALTQLAGTAGCITRDGSDQDGANQCQVDPTLSGPDGVSISADNRFLYVVDFDNITLHVFSRNASTGGLAEIQCLREASGAPAGCTVGRVLGDSQSLTLSPDGTHAYSGDFSNGISVFDRNISTGLLTQKAGAAGCITNNGKDDTGAITCTVGRLTKGDYPLLIAGATLYNVDDPDNGVSAFHVNGDGSLSQLSGPGGCVSSNGLDNTGASTCATGRALMRPYGGVLSPDGRTMYVSQDVPPAGGIALFSLDPGSGIATQLPGLLGCITADGSSNGVAGQCTNGRALNDGYGLAVSPDGSSVYQATVASSNAGLAVYKAETAPVCHATLRTAVAANPVSVPLACADADGDPVSRVIASGPKHGKLSAVNQAAGTVTYTAANGFAGTDTFTFAASDGVNTGAPVTATISVLAAKLSKLAVSPKRFSTAGRKVKGRCVKPTKKNNGNAHCRLPIKLRVSYSLSGATSVTFTVQRKVAGRKVKGRCVKPTKANRKHAKCLRLVNVTGKFTKAGRSGANRFTWNGKIGGRVLGRGTYMLVATPARGKAVKVTFTILG